MKALEFGNSLSGLRTLGLLALWGALSFGLPACSKHEGTVANQSLAETSASPSDAVLQVVNAWARPTVAEQMATGAYMKIIPSKDGTIVGVSSKVADVTEIHEMKMEGDVMRMRAVENLPVKAGSALELAPGGYHVMLMGLNQSVTEGQPFELTLIFKGTDGGESNVPVRVVPGKDPAKATSIQGEASSKHHKH